MKDRIEERLFERRRDLFTDLSLVFMDTTTPTFHGAGGEELGAREQRTKVVREVVLRDAKPFVRLLIPGTSPMGWTPPPDGIAMCQGCGCRSRPEGGGIHGRG